MRPAHCKSLRHDTADLIADNVSGVDIQRGKQSTQPGRFGLNAEVCFCRANGIAKPQRFHDQSPASGHKTRDNGVPGVRAREAVQEDDGFS